MKYKFDDKSENIIEIDDNILIGIVEPGTVSIPDEYELLTQALENPVSSPDLEQFLAGAQKLLIIINDGTRTTPTARILQLLRKYISGLDHRIIIACGSHNAPTDIELKRILGGLYPFYREKVMIHNARNSETVYLGKTSRGTEIRFNRLAVEADRIININSLEPHYFAGYTGGRKSFLPGIAAYRTIEQNHYLALKPESGILRLKGNPVHEDMEEAALVFREKVFSINLVQNIRSKLFHASAGDLCDSFYQAIPQAEKLFLSRLPEKADILIARVNEPLDRDLYQTQKGIENCRTALKKNGIMIMISSCPEGIGKDEFYQLLVSSDSPEEVFCKIDQGYVLGYHKAAKIADFLRDNQLWMVTEIPGRILVPIHIRKFDSVSTALKEAISIKGNLAEITICSDAAVTVPVIVE